METSQLRANPRSVLKFKSRSKPQLTTNAFIEHWRNYLKPTDSLSSGDIATEKAFREMGELTGKTEKAMERLLARAREAFRKRWNDDQP